MRHNIITTKFFTPSPAFTQQSSHALFSPSTVWLNSTSHSHPSGSLSGLQAVLYYMLDSMRHHLPTMGACFLEEDPAAGAAEVVRRVKVGLCH